jgi:hypothetical protein
MFFLGLKCILPWPLSVHCCNEMLGGFSILIGFGSMLCCELDKKHITTLKNINGVISSCKQWNIWNDD